MMGTNAAAMLMGSQCFPAYIDPGSGSYFHQLLLAALFAGIFTFKDHWGRLVNFISKLFKHKNGRSK